MTAMDVFFLEISDLMRWKKGCDNKQITDEQRRKGKYFVAWAVRDGNGEAKTIFMMFDEVKRRHLIDIKLNWAFRK